MTKHYGNHTIKGLIEVALPLILSIFGWTFMITIDRLMLARYDMEMMNVVVAIGTLIGLFEWSTNTIAVTSEIFSGQFNGLDKKDMVPTASWQMLFFSFLCIIIFVPIGFFGGEYLIPAKYYEKGNEFFKILMCFLFFSPATGSINGFFIGIKKTKIILFNTIFGNLLNLVLSYTFIFGVKDVLEPMGAAGAAMATSIALGVQFLVIFLVFISKGFNQKYQTRKFHFNSMITIQCLKVGIPSSIGLIIEMTGNYVVQLLIVNMLSQYESNHNIALNIFILLTFFINGLHKSVSGLAANLIGRREFYLLDDLLKSAIILHLSFSFLVVILTTILAEPIANLYTQDPEIVKFAKLTLPWVGAYFFLDGLGWTISGMTIAGGDTKFVMYVNAFVIWGFKVLPLFTLLYFNITYVSLGWVISALSAFIYAAIFIYRYKSNAWLKLKLS